MLGASLKKNPLVYPSQLDASRASPKDQSQSPGQLQWTWDPPELDWRDDQTDGGFSNSPIFCFATFAPNLRPQYTARLIWRLPWLPETETERRRPQQIRSPHCSALALPPSRQTLGTHQVQCGARAATNPASGLPSRGDGGECKRCRGIGIMSANRMRLTS